MGVKGGSKNQRRSRFSGHTSQDYPRASYGEPPQAAQLFEKPHDSNPELHQGPAPKSQQGQQSDRREPGQVV